MSYEEMLTLLGATSKPNQDLDPEVMKRDVSRLKARLAKSSRGLLNPHSKLMQYWDFCTLSALLFTATVTPYEVCLMWKEQRFATLIEDGGLPLFLINWMVNAVFIVDIGFNFFLPFREPVKKGGGLIKSHRKIARNYVRSWFPLDFLSVLPIDNVMMGIDTSNISAPSLLKMIRMLRLLRLIKLARILRASRIFSRWENKISISYASQSLIFWFVIVIFLLHMLSCALGLLAQLMAPDRTIDLAVGVQAEIDAGDAQCFGCTPDVFTTAGSFCKSNCLTPCEVRVQARLELGPGAYDVDIATREALLTAGQSWVCRYSASGAIRPPTYHGEMWVAGLYIAMIQLSGGVGSIVPENMAEYLLFLIGMFVGSVTWAMVVGTIAAVLTTGDPHTIAFKQNMDQLNYFLEDMQMPSELCMRAREYLRNTRELNKRASYGGLMGLLSPELKCEVVTQMSQVMLSSVWYFEGLEPDCMVEIALRMSRQGYAPRERIPPFRLYILMRGVAAKAGNILTPISTWGEDIIVTSKQLRDPRRAGALSFIEVAMLTREDLDEILSRYPRAHASIAQAAMKIALQRAIIVISEFLRLRRGLGSKSSNPMMKTENPELYDALCSLTEPDAEPQAFDILPLMTGEAIKEIEDVATPRDLDTPRESATEAGAAGGGLDASAVLRKLDAEKEARVRLEGDMRHVKGQLDEIVKLIKALPPPPEADLVSQMQ